MSSVLNIVDWEFLRDTQMEISTRQLALMLENSGESYKLVV